MASIEYSLFRAKFIKSPQKSLFDENLTPKDLFLSTLSEKPSGELRKGNIWHIGNIENFSDTTGYFAVGRTTNSTIEKFDDSTGNFVEEELEESPYTHCVFDAQIGLIGIAKKTSLAPTSVNIADRIKDLLSQSKTIKENNITVEIQPIPDPEGFLKALASAYQVSSFTAFFRGPNPFDADEHFQKPLSVYLSAANGEKGKAQIQGDDLNRKILQDVTRSTAATGNEASARIKKSEHQKSITINLKGNPVKRRYDEEEHQPTQVLADLTNLYRRIRYDERS
ncbi:MAG: hypothetical protein QX199_08305 [Methylococcaceae bacterium]